MLERGLVRGVDLAVVVPAAAQVPDLLVRHVLDELGGAGVAAEEVLADVGAVVGLERLVVTVRDGVHQRDERALGVLLEQRVPLAAPDDLDDVPAGAVEVGLQLLDDLAVAADGPVEPLEVAVDDEGEVVQRVVGRDLQRAARLDLVHLTVAEERPDVLLGGVLDAAVVQVAVEPRLVDGVDGTETHRDGRELPELGHRAGMGVGGQGPTRVALLLPEAVEIVLAEPTLEVRAGVHAGGGVALEEDVVTAAGMVLAAEEVVVAHFVERRRARVGRDVPAHADAGALGAVDHDGGVPADPPAVGTLHRLVARELRLEAGGDRVDVVRGGERRERYALFRGTFEQPQHQVASPLGPGLGEQTVERIHPLLGLLGIGVRQVGRDALAEDRHVGGCGTVPGACVLGHASRPHFCDSYRGGPVGPPLVGTASGPHRGPRVCGGPRRARTGPPSARRFRLCPKA